MSVLLYCSLNMAFQTWNVLMTLMLLSAVCTCELVSVGPDSIRLYGGSSHTEGVVQVHIAGQWKSLCNDGWDVVDALVACRQLGFTDGYGLIWKRATEYATTQSPLPPFPTEGNNFNCDGTEKSLLSCRYTKYGQYCSYLAGVACNVGTANYTSLLNDLMQRYKPRLSYTTTTIPGDSARRVLPVERYYNPYITKVMMTGGVCNIDSQAAMLLCQNNGFTSGGKVIKLPILPNLPMLLNRLSCKDPLKGRLTSCETSYTAEGMCSDGVHYNGIECYVTTRPSAIGSLAFAGVASVLILIAGSCGIHWIRGNVKTQPVPLDESRHHIT